MSAAKERAEEVAAMPHVQRWVKRLRKLCADMPPEVWVFSESGSPHVMAYAPDGDPYEDGDGGADQDSIVASPSGRGRWDGGGW
ncbi:MAG: hypothetical protein Q8S73_37085 [Deltaproteobacteria bacterium]|nr:hypothetical protein [Deltaproteobacteria bacterium]